MNPANRGIQTMPDAIVEYNLESFKRETTQQAIPSFTDPVSRPPAQLPVI